MTTAEVLDVNDGAAARRGRKAIGDVDEQGKSRRASCKVTPGVLAALDDLARRLVSTRSDQVRRAVRAVLAEPPTRADIEAFEPARTRSRGRVSSGRPYSAGLVQFPWTPEAGQKTALQAEATRLGVTQNTLLRYAVDRLLTAEGAQPDPTSTED